MVLAVPTHDFTEIATTAAAASALPANTAAATVSSANADPIAANVPASSVACAASNAESIISAGIATANSLAGGSVASARPGSMVSSRNFVPNIRMIIIDEGGGLNNHSHFRSTPLQVRVPEIPTASEWPENNQFSHCGE